MMTLWRASVIRYRSRVTVTLPVPVAVRLQLTWAKVLFKLRWKWGRDSRISRTAGVKCRSSTRLLFCVYLAKLRLRRIIGSVPVTALVQGILQSITDTRSTHAQPTKQSGNLYGLTRASGSFVAGNQQAGRQAGGQECRKENRVRRGRVLRRCQLEFINLRPRVCVLSAPVESWYLQLL